MVDPTATQGSSGGGRQLPTDGNSDFTVMRFVFSQMAALLDTVKLVQVVAVTGGGATEAPPTVDVQPLVAMLDGAGNATPHGTVHGLPVVRLGGGSAAIVADPKVGDVGLALVADRDSSKVTGSDPVTPGSLRHHDIADGVYLGALFGAAPTQGIAFTEDGPTLFDAAGNKIELRSTGIVATLAAGMTMTIDGPLVVNGPLQLGGAITAPGGGTYAGAIATTGNITTTAEVSGAVVKAGGLNLNTHRHTSASAGSPTSTPIP